VTLAVLAAVLATAWTVGVGGDAARADDSPSWSRPVDGAVVAPFREPTSVYGAGHRGADLAAAPGTPVRAANDGVVTFAGDVAGTLHVVVAHDGDLRTSYSFLASVAVRAGQVVARGDVLGTTGGSGEAHDGAVLHFGLRVGARYVDPMLLFHPADLTKVVHLVPAHDPDEQAWMPAGERVELQESLHLPVPATAIDASGGDDGGACGDDVPLVGGLVSEACTVASWVGDRVGDALDAGLAALQALTGVSNDFLRRLRGPLVATAGMLRELPEQFARRLLQTPPGMLVADVVEMGRRFVGTVTADCDSDAPPADGTGGSGHRVMVVAGIDSSGGAWDRPTVGLDVKALGYYRAEGEVRYFSYQPGGGPYTAPDTLHDIDRAAALLLEQLRAMQREEPGREVDLIGHSQGGVVIDVFLGKYYDPADPTLPPLGTVITLSSPHEGAPLATAVQQARSKISGRLVLDDVVGSNVPGIPPLSSTAVGQLAESSPLVRGLFPHGLPDHVNFTTIGAAGDVVVPADHIAVRGATETVVGTGVVDLPGAHGAIVRDPAALRAVRAALEGRAPPCVSLGTALEGAVVPVVISRFEHNVGAVAKEKLP
jgi:hypothetical protein